VFVKLRIVQVHEYVGTLQLIEVAEPGKKPRL
jgi:hypothetical protein